MCREGKPVIAGQPHAHRVPHLTGCSYEAPADELVHMNNGRSTGKPMGGHEGGRQNP